MIGFFRMFTTGALFCAALLASASPYRVPTGIPGVDLEFNDPSKAFVPGVVVVGFHPGVSAGRQRQILNAAGLRIDEAGSSPYFARTFIPTEMLTRGWSIERVSDALGVLPEVRFAEPDLFLFPDQVLPTDPSFNLQYAFHNTGQTGGTVDADIDAPEGWGAIPSSVPPVTVALADDGILVTHPDLAANIWVNPNEIEANGIDDDGNGFIDDIRGWDFASNDNNVHPGTAAHGTHCAGILGMVHNNGVGGAGTVRNVRIMPIKITGGSVAWMTALANGIDYARNNGARVISVSYNIDGFTTALRDAIGRAQTSDMVYVNSAGNSSQNIDTRRGTLRNLYTNVLFVASTDHNDALSSFSNFGTTVDLAAPGSAIWSTILNNGYGNNSGTSMACPAGAGVIATIRQLNPGMTAQQAILFARANSDMLPSLAGRITGGRANLGRVVETDTVNPSSPTNLRVARKSTSVVEVRFNAAGDDADAGAASQYEVRFSNMPITEANFASATAVAPVNGGVPSGTELSAQIAGLPAGFTIHIGIRALDNAGNRSAVVSAGPVRMRQNLWFENFEGAVPVNFGSGPWGISTTQAFSGTRSITDSPAGQYANNVNASAQLSSPIAVPTDGILRFRAFVALENLFDYFYIEVSSNGGTTWQRVFQITGETNQWRQYNVSLRPWSGQQLLLRFRLTTDSSVTRDGVYLDDLALVEGRTLAFDNAEGANNFTATGAWARTTADFWSPSQSWTDSPTGNTPVSTTSQIESSPTFDTTQVASPVLGFAAETFVRSTDLFTVIGRTGSGAFTEVAGWSGGMTAWGYLSAPLPVDPATRYGFRLRVGTGPQDGVYLDDFAVMGEPWFRELRGSVDMNGYIGPTQGRPLTATFLLPGTNDVVATLPVTVFHTGLAQVVVDHELNGTFDVVIDGPGFIRARTNGVDVLAATPFAMTLHNGDVNNDGTIGPADFSLVLGSFGAEPAPGTSLIDANGDGEVGPPDFSIVLANFGLEE